jgi:hypothetical protein
MSHLNLSLHRNVSLKSGGLLSMRRLLSVLACMTVTICTGTGALAAVGRHAPVARLVVWEPKPGMAKEMEEGYKRHLEWHRRNNDRWAWEGWTITSGDRFGYFVDGTFFRMWPELDNPVAPAADAADNAVNVLPYGSIRSASIYEELFELSNLHVEQLQLPVMTFCYLDVAPGRGTEFENLIGKAMATGHQQIPHAVFRSATDASRYLVMLPAEHPSSLREQAEFLSRLLQTTAREGRANLVEHVQEETARHRPELSYAPERRPEHFQ